MREQLADLCHSQWSGWMEYLFSKCDSTMPKVLSALEDGSLIIPAEFVERWQRQMETPYSELSKSEQDSDRNEADRFLAIIKATYNNTTIAVDKSFLWELKNGIMEAISSEDGLDGSDGMDLLSRIDALLGLSSPSVEKEQDGNVTNAGIMIKGAIMFLDKLELIIQNDPIVAKAFSLSPNDELHALRLAVVGLVRSVDQAELPPRRPASKIEMEAIGAICNLQDELHEAKISIHKLKAQIKDMEGEI